MEAAPRDAQQGAGGAGNRFNERDVSDYHTGEPLNKPSNRVGLRRNENGKVSMMSYLMQPMGTNRAKSGDRNASDVLSQTQQTEVRSR